MTFERAIPHLREIFGLNQQYDGKAYDENEQKTKNSVKEKKDDYRTYANGDVKTLERHLRMKKTIRKKIMRDLQQAFVEDPNEFKVENTSPEKLKAELSAEAVKIEKNVRKNDPTFLDMLRGETRGEETKEEQPPAEKPEFFHPLLRVPLKSVQLFRRYGFVPNKPTKLRQTKKIRLLRLLPYGVVFSIHMELPWK